jgi:hypothetical protein
MESSIPNVCHFSYFRGPKNWRWRDIHSLCLWTAKHVAKFEKLVVHYDVSGEGQWWALAQTIPGVEWRQETYSGQVNGHPVSDQRLPHDVARLKTLVMEGGFYADLDFVFLKEFADLRNHKAVIGIQSLSKKKLNCALMGCGERADYMWKYLDTYKAWTPDKQKTFWEYANTVPWNLWKGHPDLVTVLPIRAFYPVAWSNKTFWNGGLTVGPGSYAVHLWESLHPDLTVADLMNTSVKETITASGFPV